MKISTFLLSFLFVAGVANAATFSVQYAGASVVHSPMQYISDSCVKGPVNYDVEDSFAVITNLTGSVLNIKNYRLVHGNVPLTIMVYDLLGNAVLSKSGITGDQVIIDRNGLHSGIYFYKILNQGKEEAFGRLNVQ